MTQISSDTPEADIAYLKRLARAGTGEPAPFLLLMAVFGGGYGLAALALALIVSHAPAPDIPPQESPSFVLFRWTLAAATLLFLATAAWTGWRVARCKGRALNQAAAAAWAAAFGALIVTYAAIRIYSRGEAPTDSVYSAYLLFPFVLILWGCAWWVTASATRRPALFIVAGGSFIAALAAAHAGNTPSLLWVVAASLLLLAFVPAIGLMLRRTR